jgi:hypothetical protein
VISWYRLSLTYFGGQTPKTPQTGTGSWCATCIRAMLYRVRYAEIIEYGRTQKTRNGGSVGKRIKGSRIVTVKREDLRIIDPNLWDRAHAQPKAFRETYIRNTNGTLWGQT